MKYSTTYINRNYRVKAYGKNAEGQKVNTLLGVSGTIALIGAELFEKFLDRAERDAEDVCVCKLRRGLKISIYVR